MKPADRAKQIKEILDVDIAWDGVRDSLMSVVKTAITILVSGGSGGDTVRASTDAVKVFAKARDEYAQDRAGQIASVLQAEDAAREEATKRLVNAADLAVARFGDYAGLQAALDAFIIRAM